MRLLPDQVLDGRYRLIERIGSGGMADVWRAHDSQLGRDVAIKVLHENFARDKEFVERFRREASSAAGLQHPNVVSVFDRGEYEDTYFIAMELVDGSSLRDLINRGLEPSEAVEVTRQVLSAASFAHSKGIVHRDLKPLNVLIDREGRIRVTDFGIASAGGSEITRTGSVMGTAQYISPEQAQGMPVTGASDIYSIGIMLFEMLTGHVPFDGDNAVAIAMKQVAEEPPLPSSINPAVGPALDAVVMRSLAKDPAQRFSSAQEMIAALDSAEADPEKGGHTRRFAAMVAEDQEDRPRRWPWIALLIALLIAGGALAYFLTPPDLVDVPDVSGKSEAQATLDLRDAGFNVDTVQRQNDGVPDGTVIDSDPSAGEQADKGSTVTIFVSTGPGTVAVPRVTGLPVADAKAKLKESGFNSEVSKQASKSVDAGTVINTDPGQGTNLQAGETVTLIVSTGVATETVPNVVGLSRQDAASQLRGLGFVVEQRAEDSDADKDQVLTQNPSSGAEVDKGSTVTITYSNGAGTITLGDFVGQKLTYAQRKLGGQGLSVSLVKRTVTDSSQDGIVLQQAPPAGSNLSPGDRVTLTVGEFIAPTTPPGGSTTTTTTP
jgi:beta-lactam-binding protein with PASTA domain